MNPTTHKLVHILEEKNKSLEQFYSLGRQRLGSFQKGDFRQLKSFYLSRERLLQNINQLEGEIELLADKKSDLSLALRSQIVQLQQVRRHWINKIVGQDLRMLGFVEKAKSKMICKLQNCKKNAA